MTTGPRIVAVYEFNDWDRLTPEAVGEMYKRAREQARQIGGDSLMPALGEFRVEGPRL